MRKLYSLLTTGILYVCGLSQTVVLPSGISNTENYVYTRTYLDATSTSSRDVKQIQSVTYFDGLGRPIQKIDIKASHGKADMVTRFEYDALGRQEKDFLPMPQQGTTHGSIYGSVSEAVGAPLYGGLPPYFAKKETEYSPLERPLSTTAPGAWGANNKKVEMNYAFNTAADKVKMYSTDPASWADSTTAAALKIVGEFPANRLYKNKVTDEDGNASVEFKNKLGQIVLVRKVVSSTQNADTYYVYNEYQDLVYVLPPLFSDKNKNATTVLLTSDDDLQEFCYQYKYDKKSRLVEKKLPGKGLEYMVYDNQDRLVMAQDANLKKNNRWLFTKYDAFGRVAYTGTTTDSRSRDDIQGKFTTLAGNNVARKSGGVAYGQGVTLQYDNDATKNYPNIITELLSINYYDTYPNSSPALPAGIQGQEVLQQDAPGSAKSTKGLPTATFVKNIGQSAWTRSFLRYDMKGRMIATHGINHLGGYTKTESLLEFSGVPKKTLTHHSRVDAPTPTVTIVEEFSYDDQNRLTKHEHTVNSNPPETLAEITYNEIGRLVKKNVGNNIQEVDYSYNIRGWMTGINLNAAGNFQAGKLFNYRVNYNDPTKAPGYPETDAALQVRSRWNGNIAEVFWRNDGDTDDKKYGYAYDALNRLVAGVYRNPLNPSSLENSEWPTYDLNGNILTLRRTSYFVGTAASLIDDLRYTYAGNRATRIVDDSQDGNGYEGGGATITYDANGNMDSMPDKWINAIAYNLLNLPSYIDIGSGKRKADVGYLYNSAGAKLRKTSNSLGRGMSGNIVTVTNTTDYLDGFQYLSTHTSETLKREEPDSELEFAMEREAFILEEAQEIAVAPPGSGTAVPAVLQFVPTAEGFYSFTESRYIYQYRDHLGNSRVSYAKSQDGGVEVVDKNDYYPFGMSHLDPDGGAFFGQSSYKNYKFGGKELQETGFYDFGARFYMSDILIFGTHDPLSEKTMQPYAYANNNPIFYNDPTGMEAEAASNDSNETGGGGESGGSGGFGGLADSGKCPPNCPDGYTKVDSGKREASIEGVTITGKAKASESSQKSTASSASWLMNTGISAASTGNIQRSGFLKYNELWHQTQTRGTSFATQNRWNNPGARYWRGQQIKAFQNARNLGSKLTKAGGVLLAADVIISGQVKPSHYISGTMLGVSVTGVGSIAAGAWFVTDMGVGAFNYINANEFRTLSDVIDQSDWGKSITIDMYKGF